MQPKQITTAVTRAARNEPTSSPDMQQLSPALRQKTMLVLREFGNRENFTKVCGPMAQLVVGRDPQRAILSEKSPTLVVMKKAYGDNFPVAWLMEQILELVVYSNSKGTLNDYQAEFLANTIVNEHYDLKASELLLFFYKFKAGKYGHFYGVIDPMRIIIALDEFCDERDRVIEQHRKEVEKAQAAMEPKLPKMLPEDWCRANGFPECRTVIEAWRMRNRIQNIIEGVLWFINILWRALP